MDAGTSSQPLLSGIGQLEAQLAAALKSASEGIARSETLDDEQRSEIYSILQALSSDSQSHRKTIGRWVNDVTGEWADV